MHSNSELSVNIEKYYGKPIINKPNIEVNEDFFIENAKAEINIRLGQSKFRKGVLKNFGSKCALTEICEPALLTASHIIPWAHKKQYRADISNGICLYVEIDALFDKGFITFNDKLETIISTDLSSLSEELRNRLIAIKGKKLRPAKKKKLKLEYLEYHRNMIFKG
jgi:predicted restriction endonuclease